MGKGISIPSSRKRRCNLGGPYFIYHLGSNGQSRLFNFFQVALITYTHLNQHRNVLDGKMKIGDGSRGYVDIGNYNQIIGKRPDGRIAPVYIRYVALFAGVEPDVIPRFYLPGKKDMQSGKKIG